MARRLKKKKRRKKKNQIKILTNDLKRKIEHYLDKRVKKPALQTVDKAFNVQKDVGTILALFNATEGLILDHGKEAYVQNLAVRPKEEIIETIKILKPFIDNPDGEHHTQQVHDIINKHLNKKHLLSYLSREINWICVSLLSASYIGSLVLTRSVFELLVGIATNNTGYMSDRLESIGFLSEEEYKQIKNAWYKLCAWAHPYGKWEKEICPIFYSHNPVYHPKIYKECFSKLALLLDFFLIITVERFGISAKVIKNTSNEIVSEIIDDYVENFPLFLNRLKKEQAHSNN